MNYESNNVAAELEYIQILRSMGCTCTPGLLWANRVPAYAEDITCPVHRRFVDPEPEQEQ